jgi:CheY-like chemotaxis protein/anti-sigma regulatory factor (Ser/Thr protein kinase)
VTLSLDVDQTIGLIEADERKVKQVVFNLLSNAVKFTADRGRVDVVARLIDSRVQVSVRDTGVGIAPQDQARIFEDFQQAESSTATAREGTGLGLALARRFVELHGGRLWVESQVGVGSTFTFTLPTHQALEDEPSAVPQAAARASAKAPLNGRTILVVEDNPQAVDLLTLYLRADGFIVMVAQDGEAALTMARELHPTAIVLDILLPRLDGWDVLARAKADPSIASIPVVVVSMLDERGKGFSLGAADYLVKPVQRGALLATLRRVMLPANNPTRRTVLAIDDDPRALQLIEAVLAPEGYVVLKATGGQEGVAIAQLEQPGLVILDLLMPELDGFWVIERLRADPATIAIPIVILTSRSMESAERDRLNGKISHLAQKGAFNRTEFVDMVRALCPMLDGSQGVSKGTAHVR